MSEEIWKELPGYEGLYVVSNHGRVRGLKRGGILRPSHCKGHPGVQVCQNGICRYIKISALVMLTFVGPRPKDHWINHIDNNPSNCDLENLQYATQMETIWHSVTTRKIDDVSRQRVYKFIDELVAVGKPVRVREVSEALNIPMAIAQNIVKARTKTDRLNGRSLTEIERGKKLSKQDREKILQLLDESKYRQYDIAKMFDVDPSVITRIKRKREITNE